MGKKGAQQEKELTLEEPSGLGHGEIPGGVRTPSCWETASKSPSLEP